MFQSQWPEFCEVQFCKEIPASYAVRFATVSRNMERCRMVVGGNPPLKATILSGQIREYFECNLRLVGQRIKWRNANSR